MKKKLAITINIIIILFVTFSLLNSAFHFLGFSSDGEGIKIFRYYTNISNLLAGIMAVVTLIYMMLGKNMPRVVVIIKLAATVMLSITFLVVIFYLAPFVSGWKIFYNPRHSLFVHCLTPILVVFEYLMLADIKTNSFDEVFQSSTTLIYAIIAIIVVLKLGDDKYAPYPFLAVNEQNPVLTILFIIFFIGFAIGLGYLYNFIRNKTINIIKD